uniref:Twin-arginine translocase TatA n=1 Tax=Hemiarma marina TaxID=1848298 RepID=A0A679EMW5_9CRYP|nr:twin-arginine translocase TatA [Hemiarma marina]
MTVGWAQLLVLVIVGMVLFGNLPKIVRDLGKSAEEASDSVNRIKNKLAEKESSSKEGK